jgi:hypothetical protein
MTFTLLVLAIISSIITLGMAYMSYRLRQWFRQHSDELVSYQTRLSEDAATLDRVIGDLRTEMASARSALLQEAEQRLHLSFNRLCQDFREQIQAEAQRELTDRANEERESALEELRSTLRRANLGKRGQI